MNAELIINKILIHREIHNELSQISPVRDRDVVGAVRGLRRAEGLQRPQEVLHREVGHAGVPAKVSFVMLYYCTFGRGIIGLS